ncbi:uncharacterized protein BXZ73DRAFT_54031 [Epithele typhae]|uniref:uncharacterized protein n=1 Tax=Epithele typhae TaxID=378194 RepID=UPI00200781AD|nr:uncharacterized protein BXZ73DRAFT_54031 [Epithele typhae]KAH9915963.1 hypothetical protein BXZ73DRAFT_54031 [Epithele typhae]
MCSESCMAYTSPKASKEICNHCSSSRYDQKKRAVRTYYMFPLAPQLLAHYSSSESAHDMRHRQRRMPAIIDQVLRSNGNVDHISDVYEGSDFWEACLQGRIKDDDICVILSMDGAQLFAHKASNCWIYIWILLDVAPEKR